MTILPDSESSRRDLSFETHFEFFVFFFRPSVRSGVRPAGGSGVRPSEKFPPIRTDEKFSSVRPSVRKISVHPSVVRPKNFRPSVRKISVRPSETKKTLYLLGPEVMWSFGGNALPRMNFLSRPRIPDGATVALPPSCRRQRQH